MNYATLARLATKMLGAFGRPCTLTRDGTRVGSGHCVFGALDRSLDSAGGLQTAVDAVSATLSAMPSAPQVGDVLAVGRERYVLRRVDATAPGGVDVAYKVQGVPGG